MSSVPLVVIVFFHGGPRCVSSVLLCVPSLIGCTTQTAVPPTRIPVAEVPTFIPAIAQVGTLEPAPLPDMTMTPTETAVYVPTPLGDGIRPPIKLNSTGCPMQDQKRRKIGDHHRWMYPSLITRMIITGWNGRFLPAAVTMNWNGTPLATMSWWLPWPLIVFHHGMDFPNDPGTPVLAAGSGTIVHAGPLPSPRNGLNYYGNTVVIHHDWQWQGKDVYTLYAHTLELFVEVGDYVRAGQLIAGVGSTGAVSGPHLHLEVRVGSNHYGSNINPALWLAPYDGWGTLAGRFIDKNGRMISGATIRVTPKNVDTFTRVQRTYHPSIRSDDVWRENFVVADLPAGDYTLRLDVGDH